MRAPGRSNPLENAKGILHTEPPSNRNNVAEVEDSRLHIVPDATWENEYKARLEVSKAGQDWSEVKAAMRK